MAAISVEDLVKRNKQYATQHPPTPTFAEMGAVEEKAKIVMIVSCADPRVIPEQIMQFGVGEVAVMRTCAGHPQPVMKGIASIDSFLDITDLMIIHHTDCGATHFTHESVRASVKAYHNDPSTVDNMEFEAIETSLEQSVKDDVNFVKSSPLIRKKLAERTYGFVYDIKSGELTRIQE